MPIFANAFTGVTLVLSAPTPTNLQFVEEFKHALAQSKVAHFKVSVVDLTQTEKLQVPENGEVVLALGVKALEVASNLKPNIPVVGVYVPLPMFHALLERTRRELGNFSAIVLDQPYARQIALINAMLPEARKIGVMLGAASTRYAEDLREQGEKNDVIINTEFLAQEGNLIPQLHQLLDTSDALLAIPDAAIYNRETAQPILLTSYRHQKPVFGYSQSYVKAGALAAVYTTTPQLARQALELILAAHQTQNVLGPPQVPKYFSVVINQQVARALNVAAKDEESVQKKLQQMESQP